MKNLSIILIGALMALVACTKSKEVHPEIGDGNDEIVTVGKKDVHVEYARTDHAELQKVVFHYCLAETQQFAVAEMTKRETFFELTLNDLYSDTLYYYYYELFPIGGNAYQSEQKTFHTQAFDTPEPPEPPTPPSAAPEGAINGLFTVNANGDQVYFSQGNLQYQASTNTWRFAEHQWDCVGGVDNWTGVELGNVYENGVKCNNSNVSSDYEGWIDLFGWGTSGWNSGNVYYHPWDYIYSETDGNLYGPPELCDLTGLYANCDWGVYNVISNGGSQSHLWRAFSKEEWDYVTAFRNTVSGVRFAFAKINNVKGLLLLPDNWDTCTYNLNNINQEASFNSNIISLSQWGALESAGAVFLPAAGRRIGTSVIDLDNTNGWYWSVSCTRNREAYCYDFYDMFIDWNCHPQYLYYGLSVRLIQDAN